MIRVLTIALAVLCAVDAFPADYAVTSGDSVVDGDTFCGGVCQPGDRLIVDGGTRGELTFQDLNGSSGNPIIVLGDSSDARIEMDVGGGINGIFRDLEWVTFDFTNDYTGKAAGGYCGASQTDFASNGKRLTDDQCGLRIYTTDGANTTHLAQTKDSSKNLIFRGIEFDGTGCNKTGSPRACIGFYLGDHDYEDVDCREGTVLTAACEKRENITFERLYFHDTFHEGIYAGPNWQNSTSDDDLPLGDITFQYIWVENAGWGGLQMKTILTGDAIIQYNVIDAAGLLANDTGHTHCLMVDGAATIRIRDNWTERCGGNGINGWSLYVPDTVVADSDCIIENNVVHDAGNLISGRSAVNFFRFNNSATTNVPCIVQNNTIEEMTGNGITWKTGTWGFDGDRIARGNIITNITGSVSSGTSSATDNLTGATSAAGFVDAASDNFQLDSGSAAIDVLAANFPAADHLGVSRPQGVNADQGAFEFQSGGGSVGSVIFGKPSAFTIDTLETFVPEHCWVMNEGTGTNLNDDCADALSGTAWDLTITGADWGTDGLHGDKLAFVQANSDYAQSGTISLSGTHTVLLLVKVAAPTGDLAETFGGVFDASDDDSYVSFQSTPSSGLPHGVNTLNGTFDTVNGSVTFTDNEWRAYWIRFSDTDIDVAIDDQSYNALTVANTGLVALLDRFALGGRRDSTPSNYSDMEIMFAAVWESDVTDANRASIWNGGDLWANIGVDESAGGEGGGDPSPRDGSYLNGVSQ